MITKRQFDKFIWKYGTPSAILVGALFIAVSIYLSFGIPNLRLAFSPLPQSLPPLQADGGGKVGGESVNVSADDDPFLGKANAPVTMIEFSDFQCPFCRKFWREAFSQIKKNYIDSGQVKFVYRDFPIASLHPAAEAAAYAGECAQEQGKFWQMHDKIFEEQDRQGQGTITFGVADLKNWAREIGLSEEEFNSCLDSQKYREEVQRDLEAGLAAGVAGTPTFYLNGRVVRGALEYEQFAKVIEEEL